MAFGRLFGSGYRELGYLRLYALIVSDSAFQKELASFTPRSMDDDTMGYFAFEASLLRYRGERSLARAYDDSARTKALSISARHADDGLTQAELAVADAYLGRSKEAVEAGRRSAMITPPSKDAIFGQEGPMALAEVYTAVGDVNAAVSQLKALLAVPSFVSAAWLRIDPVWSPLRGNAEFERLARRS